MENSARKLKFLRENFRNMNYINRLSKVCIKYWSTRYRQYYTQKSKKKEVNARSSKYHDTIKRPNIHSTGADIQTKGTENLFNEIIPENIFRFGETIYKN